MAELNAEDISSRYLPYLLPALLGATVVGRGKGPKPLSGDRAAFDWGVKNQLEPGNNILRDLKGDFKGVPFSQREPAPPGVGSPDVTPPPPASVAPSLPGIRSSDPGQGPAIPYSKLRDTVGGMDPAGNDWRYINQQKIPLPTPRSPGPQPPPPSAEEMAEVLKGGGSRIIPPTTEAPNIPRPGFSRPEGEGAGAGPLPGFLREEPEPMIMPPRGGGTPPSGGIPSGSGGRGIPRWALPIGLGTLGATATASELGDLENKPAPPDYANQAKRAFGLESTTPADMRDMTARSKPPFDVYDTTTQGIKGGAAGGISGSMAEGPAEPSRPPQMPIRPDPAGAQMPPETAKYEGPDLQNKFPGGKVPLPKNRPEPQKKPQPGRRPAQPAPQQSNPQADILRDFIGALFNKPVSRYQPPYPAGWPSSYRNE